MAMMRDELDPHEKHSMAMISGRLHNEAQVQGDTARFSLINGDGSFFIKVQGHTRIKQCQALKPGDAVVVIGYLGSFVFKRCHSHHTFIQGMVVLGTEEVWADLWETAGVPVLLRSLYSELLHQEQGLGEPSSEDNPVADETPAEEKPSTEEKPPAEGED